MTTIQKQIVEKAINTVDGIIFKDSHPFDKASRVFFEDRYAKVLSMLPRIKGNAVGLEIGLAGGILAVALVDAFHLKELYTLEHPVTCELYTPKFLQTMKKHHIRLKKVDLREKKLPWPDNTFDFIVFSETIEHLIPSDLPDIFQEIERVLKKKGVLLITTPHIGSLLKRINLLRGKNPVEFDLRLHEGATFGHIREYTLPELTSILENYRFTIEHKGYFMIDTKRNIFTQIEGVSSQLFPSLANNITILVRKR